mgnify:CR=1 FL=1|jgi:hypothetical protein
MHADSEKSKAKCNGYEAIHKISRKICRAPTALKTFETALFIFVDTSAEVLQTSLASVLE